MAAQNPTFTTAGASSGAPVPSSSTGNPRKRRGHRGGKSKKKKGRRTSFAIPNDEIDTDDVISTSMAPTSQSFYGQRHNLSGTSIDSENLLDHRYSFLVFFPTVLANTS